MTPKFRAAHVADTALYEENLSLSGGMDMTEGSLWRNILAMSWPTVVAMLLQCLIGLTDTLIAGQLGSSAQAIVGFATAAFFIFLTTAMALQTGVVAMVSQAYGGKRFEVAAWYSRNALLLALGLSLVMVVPAIVFAPYGALLLDVPDVVRQQTVSFLRLFMLSLIPQIVWMVTLGIFRAIGDAKTPMIVGVAVAITNVICGVGFALGKIPGFPQIGLNGIAMGTLISSCIGLIGSLSVFLASPIAKIATDKPFSWAIVGKLFRIGYPVGLQRLCYQASNMILYTLLSHVATAHAMAAMMIGIEIESFAFLPTFALNIAAATLVGQNLGADQPERAKEAAWHTVKMGICLMTLMGVFFFVCAEPLAAFFSSDPATRLHTVQYLKINALSEPFLALTMVLTGALHGAGQTQPPFRISILCSFIFKVPFVCLLMTLTSLGAISVWIGMTVSMTLQGILITLYFKKGSWLRSKIV